MPLPHKRLPYVWTVAICLSAFVATQAAEIAKMELWLIRTVNLSDQQFLMGVKTGTEATIAGALRIPRSSVDKLPAMVLVHGSNGIGASGDVWARHFNDLGIATFNLDAFTGRGIIDTGADQEQLGNLTMINDAYRALEMLAKHPRIDPKRIGILGQSRGGRVALYASMKRFQQLYGPPGVEFAVYLPFFAPCYTRFIGDTEVSDNPIHLFHGSTDNYVTVGPCRDYVQRLGKAGKNAALTEYPGAHHGFDSPGVPVTKIPSLQSARSCTLEEVAGGLIVNRATKKPFTWEDPCVERGATVGSDARAQAEATNEVTAILKQVLKIE